MSEWVDTPENQRIFAERPDGERVRFSELRAGEVVRFVGIEGTYIEPWPDYEPTESWFKVEEPRQADGTECSQDFGWCVPIEEVEDPRKEMN